MLDRLIDDYVEWRESATAVADAYARWCFASRPERALQYAAYLAALDQEQNTAAAYADAVADVALSLCSSASRRGP